MSNIVNNWEHRLVGDEYIYSFQAGSDLVKITSRKDLKVDILISSEELCNVAEFIKYELGEMP